MSMNFKMILIVLLSIGIGYIHGLSCYCGDLEFQPNLDIKTASYCDAVKCCPSGEQVLGICGCCPTCAKAENESCGGLWGSDGTCATGFYCSGGYHEEGICTKIEHQDQYQTDNPEWHKSVPTCDNPTYESSTTTTAPSSTGCGSPNWKGDNYCDDDNNNAGCEWDGGDCCGDDVKTQYCSACECLDPNEQKVPNPK